MTRSWVFLLLLSSSMPLAAGVVFEVEIRSLADPMAAAAVSHIRVEGDNVKITGESSAETPRSETIYLGDRGHLLIIDHVGESFLVMDREGIQAMAAQMKASMDASTNAMAEAMTSVPEEERRQLEEQLSEMMRRRAGTSPIELTSAGETEQVGDYAAVRHVAMREGSQEAELAIAPWSEIEGGADSRAALEGLAGFLDDTMSALEGTGAPLSFGQGVEILRHIVVLEGFPVASKAFEGGAAVSESTLSSATIVADGPADFAPPAGYTERVIGRTE